MLDFLKEQGRFLKISGNEVFLINGNKLDSQSADTIPILSKLQDIASDGFGVEMEMGGSSGIQAVVKNNLIAIAWKEEIMGFATAEFLAKYNCLYLHGIAIPKCNQMVGLGFQLIKVLLDYFKAHKIALTTQSPVIYYLLSKNCDQVYPQFNTVQMPQNIKDVCQEIMKMKKHLHLLEADTFVLRDFYSRCLYDKIPDSKNSALNDFFKKSLRIANGITKDGFVLICENK